MHTIRLFAPLALAFSLQLTAVFVTAQAQEFPSRSLQVIVPFTAGGPTDAMARVMGRELSRLTGQPVVVENRPGAGGNVGSAQVARAEPDGYTMIVNGGLTHTLNPQIFAKTSGYALKDFKAVAAFAKSPMVLTVNPDLGVNDVQQLVALAKSKPGGLSFASGGQASNPHMAAELFRANTQTDMLHIPYKGTADSVKDIVSGRVQVGFFSPQVAEPLLQAGRLKALGVTSTTRIKGLENISTIAEQGVKDFVFESWYIILVPVTTPAPIVNKLNQLVNQALDNPDTQKAFSNIGLDVIHATPAQTEASITAEQNKWSELVKKIGLQLD
ncbi:MAG: tripartite tricarboxylate transporter substrate binding protein [Alcaligenaceae bacterium]